MAWWTVSDDVPTISVTRYVGSATRVPPAADANRFRHPTLPIMPGRAGPARPVRRRPQGGRRGTTPVRRGGWDHGEVDDARGPPGARDRGRRGRARDGIRPAGRAGAGVPRHR